MCGMAGQKREHITSVTPKGLKGVLTGSTAVVAPYSVQMKMRRGDWRIVNPLTIRASPLYHAVNV